MSVEATKKSGEAKGFGTFGGVFTPSVLTILGVVMYMRLGWVTGQAGLGVALGIVVISHVISLVTGLSVSSIATNRTVGAGGAYFMISRSLGGAAGASIGIPLFFAQALSATFYIVGFSESVLQLVPEAWQPWVPAWAIGTVVNVLLTALSLKSSDLAIKAQYVVMVAIVASLVGFFTGRSPDFPAPIEWTNPEGVSPMLVFAAFFPAVTGIMAGVSMSGDLKDPRKSLPRGTLAAIGVGFVVYMAFPIWLALNYSNEFLADPDNTDAAFQLASIPATIYAGVWGATLSSALGSILTAPRTMQALARDGLMPRFLGKGYGPSHEPRAGTLLTFAIAQTGIVLGNLDLIAPVLTMFFLATYGVTNLACGLQRWAASPSFRPSFEVPAWVGLLGGAACFVVMFLIDPGAMVVAMLLCGLIFFVAQRRALGATYGDARHGMWAALVRSALHRLRRVEFHPVNWRPNLIVFGGDPEKRPHLLHLSSSLVQDRGVVTYFHLLEGEVRELAEKRRALFDRLDPVIHDKFANVFFRVDVAQDVYRGTVAAAQSYGVGNFAANAVMLGWSHKPERAEAYVNMLQDLVLLDRTLLIVRYHPEKKLGEGRNLHVWLGGDDRTQAMLLLFAQLLTSHYRWRHMEITVLDMADSDQDKLHAQSRLHRLLTEARIEAETRVVLRQGRTMEQVLHVESEHADFALVGIELPERDDAPVEVESSTSPERQFVERVGTQLAELPTTILVHSARSFDDQVLLDRDE
ncbi:MAG TPA: amino acid permease [Sandaracinaceae bacterium LLY-WYZ-13_1]|nr:amino acid permease [Sandaracinaceae bacterium LLY-WYZ-13_1]